MDWRLKSPVGFNRTIIPVSEHNRLTENYFDKFTDPRTGYERKHGFVLRYQPHGVAFYRTKREALEGEYPHR